MSSQKDKDFIVSHTRELWKKTDSSKLDQYYSKDVVGHHNDVILSYEDVKNRIDYGSRHFMNGVFNIEDIFSEDGKVLLRFRWTATFKESGEPLESQVAYIYHLKDGKIAEFWLISDKPFKYRAWEDE